MWNYSIKPECCGGREVRYKRGDTARQSMEEEEREEQTVQVCKCYRNPPPIIMWCKSSRAMWSITLSKAWPAVGGSALCIYLPKSNISGDRCSILQLLMSFPTPHMSTSAPCPSRKIFGQCVLGHSFRGRASRDFPVNYETICRCFPGLWLHSANECLDEKGLPCEWLEGILKHISKRLITHPLFREFFRCLGGIGPQSPSPWICVLGDPCSGLSALSKDGIFDKVGLTVHTYLDWETLSRFAGQQSPRYYFLSLVFGIPHSCNLLFLL